MFEAKVEAFLKRHSFDLKNKQIVVGVSGGPDSLALLHYLIGQREKWRLDIIAAHVDHMFRGEESFEDALFVKGFCEQHSIPFEMARINVPERILQTGNNSQLEAREARYEFFRKVMEQYGYPYLALAHHGDDQIETILMRFTRGSTGKARAGIPFMRPFGNGWIFRPFLALTRAEIEQYCRENDLKPRIDPSNEKSIYSRNRFRKVLLPFLKGENDHVHEHFQRFSEELQSDETLLQELTAKQMNTVMTIGELNKITIDIKKFLEMPLPLQRRGIQLILNYLYKDKPSSLSAIHIDQISTIIQQSRASGKLNLPNGLEVVRSYQTLSFQYMGSSPEAYYFELNGPGSIELPNGGMIKLAYINKEYKEKDPFSAMFDADQIKWPIIVRTRKTGDRMALKGMLGSKKIKDIFIDRKVPRQQRDIWPVITDGEGCIIWLPGLKKSSFEGIGDSNKRYIQLTFLK